MTKNTTPLSWVLICYYYEGRMSELVVFKANELAMSRYDLTEHETKLLLCCVALLNPTVENPTRSDRTISFTYHQYAKMMGLSSDNAYHRLNNATSELMTRTVEIIYPTGDVSKRIFQWVNYAEFNRKTQSLTLVFSEDILPYLFQIKRFIKYNLEHVKAFENKYSIRIYEWLLKELTQRKTHNANIEISVDEFKFMLMLTKKYTAFKELNRWVLKAVTKDLNTYSNMQVNVDKRGRPTNTLIFQCSLNHNVDLTRESDKSSHQPSSTINTPPIPKFDNSDGEQLHSALNNVIHLALTAKVQLTSFEANFLSDLQKKYKLNGSFSWLSEKQKSKLISILSKYEQY